jgi:ribosomal-protein-alanine N-acetyltransferase
MRSYFMRTSRLGFGTWGPDDLDLAMGLWGDDRVTQLIGGPFSPDWVRDRLAREISTQAALGFQYWPIFRLSDDAHLGCCGLRPVPGKDGVLELGFHLRAEHWGQGFATESARAVITYAFATLAAVALVAGHHPQNDASRHVLQRLGFRFMHAEFYAPTGLDHPSYALAAGEFAPGSPGVAGP